MTIRRVGRRMFLAGAGGFALSVPFLPSLLSREAARAQPVAPPRRFVAMWTGHGGVWNEYMWPGDGMATQSEVVVPSRGHTAYYGPLTATQAGGEAVLSEVIRGASSTMTSSLISKMNLLRGLDVPWYCAHGTHAFGNYGPMMLADPSTGAPENQATVDQYLAWSGSFYEAVPRKRSIHIGGARLSSVWANPESRDGGYQLVPPSSSSLGLFNEIYVPPVDPGTEPTRPPVTDRVLESYRRLVSGAHGPGARLGGEDRVRIESYMDRIRALEESLNAGVAASCSEVVVPSVDARGTDHAYSDYANRPDWYGPNFYQVYNDVIVAAFLCDSSRVATIGSVEDWFGRSDDYGGYHDGIAHEAWRNRERAEFVNVTHRSFFQMAYLDLIAKLDGAVEADGSTVLDNSLVWWTQESGSDTHINDSQPVVMAGSAGGNLRTGYYVDYRNRDMPLPNDGMRAGPGRRHGLHYYQWFTTILDAMGIPRSEWQTGTQPFSGSAPAPSWLESEHPYEDAILSLCDDPLPIISNMG